MTKIPGLVVMRAQWEIAVKSGNFAFVIPPAIVSVLIAVSVPWPNENSIVVFSEYTVVFSFSCRFVFTRKPISEIRSALVPEPQHCVTGHNE